MDVVLLQCAVKVGQSSAAKETSPNVWWRGPDGHDIGIVGESFRTQLANGSLFFIAVEENRSLTDLY